MRINKIIISEAGSIANIGSAALIINAVEICKKKYPNSSICVLSQDPESTKNILDQNIESLGEIFIFPIQKSKFQKYIWFIQNLLWLAFFYVGARLKVPFRLFTSSHRKRTLDAIRNADLVICIGAERINDNYVKGMLFSFIMLKIMINFKKDIVHLSLTVGPIYRKITKYLARKILGKSKLLFVRDRKSFNILCSLGIDRKKIINTYDIAILQDAISETEAISILNRFNVPFEKTMIGVSVLKWNYKYENGSSDYEEYIHVFANICDELIDKFNVHIVFTPTNFRMNNNIYDDVEVSKEVIQSMKQKSCATIIDQLLTPSELKGIYKLFEMSIVTRMHAAILCSMSGTPIVSVNYLYKLEEFMKHLGLVDHSVGIEDLHFDELWRIVDHVYLNRKSLEKNLKNIVLPKMLNEFDDSLALLK